ncbi:TetR/AcrR family transcriptional regulator [Sphingomonas tabacisoli]|uniref:TetR/AcrR family transcriptional regulator n=1 Tax=Sphingomonas tabacisoli TaxID=2249466 RepID=A0ABW4I507_9SPHN
MARTQAADYEQRREAIVEEAAQLFAARGFMGASVADLAEACKTSKSLIYHYYPSKEDILYAVMASHIDQLVQDVSEVSAEGGDAKAQLRAIVHRFMQHYVGAASRQKVLLNELDSLPADKRAEIVTRQRAIIDTVTRLLCEISPDLASDPARARVQTMLLFGMINWTHTWYDPAGPVGPDTIADMALSLILC